jgi:hypothetical protein
MTQPPLIDHSWVGIECLIQGSGAKTLVNGSTRYQVTLSFNATDDVRDLIAELALNNRGKVFVGFGFMQVQAELPFDLTTMDPPPGIMILQAANGEVITQHPFKASEEDPALCTFCETAETHEIHVAATRGVIAHAWRDNGDGETCFWCKRDVGDAQAHFQEDHVVEPASTSAEEVLRRSPADADEAAEQALAEAALAARSK